MRDEGLSSVIGLILIGLLVWFIGIPVGIFLLKILAIMVMMVKG